MNIVGTGAANEGGFTGSTGNVGVCSIQRPTGPPRVVINADRSGGSWTGSVCAAPALRQPEHRRGGFVHRQRTSTLTFP